MATLFHTTHWKSKGERIALAVEWLSYELHYRDIVVPLPVVATEFSLLQTVRIPVLNGAVSPSVGSRGAKLTTRSQ